VVVEARAQLARLAAEAERKIADLTALAATDRRAAEKGLIAVGRDYGKLDGIKERVTAARDALPEEK
jgi:hypothetical protein